MKNKMIIGVVALVAVGFSDQLALAGDMDDGISKYTDESISSDDNMGKTETNINFIVVDAMAEAKAMEYQAKQDSDDKESSKDSKKKNSKINYNDGSGENNQNSIVVGTGSKVEKVININIGK